MKTYTPEGKESIHRHIWKNIFNDDEDEEAEDDEQAETYEMVRHYLEDNLHRTTPYHTTDTGRLDNNNHTTEHITLLEIQTIIKQMKKNMPRGERDQ